MAQNIAIVGATGAVGSEFLKLLDVRNYPIKNLVLLASERSVGKEISFKGEKIKVKELKADSFKGIDVAFFSAGASRSKEFAPFAVKDGALVVDNSSAFRMDADIPLVVPEVNPQDARKHRGLIANPNCSTIQMVVALQPLHLAANIKRVVVSTYQAVSGAGASAMDELVQQVKSFARGESLNHSIFPKQIAFNLIPHIDVFQDNGYTKEEMKMVLETRKIMHAPEMMISATCVRVPVLRAHSESINIETERKLSAEQAREILANAPGIKIIDTRSPGGYPVPWEVAGTMDTYVGRIREDISVPNGLAFWIVADQLFKGAALNAIQIAELLNS